MDFIQNSGDILNIVISLSIFIFTVFICWILYYVVASTRNLFKITKEIRENIEKSKELIELVKKRIKTTFSVVSFLDDGAEKIKDIVQKYKKGKEKNAGIKTKKTSIKSKSKPKHKAKPKAKNKKE